MVESIKGSSLNQDIYKCYSCGICTTVCPLSSISDFKPRIIAENWILGLNEVDIVKDIWTCLSCGSCATVCPMTVNFPEWVRDARLQSIQNGFSFEESHNGIFSAISRLMTNPDYIGKSRLDLFKDLKVSEKGEYLYFIGCLPFFEIVFDYPYTDIAKNAVNILNKIGITPVILKNERCCGHDLLWNGDIENFKKLGELNIKAIEATGAKTVITTCAECYRTLKLDYPKYFENVNFEVISFSEFIESEGISKLPFHYEFPYKVTYHDPCRLGKHLGVYDAPRNILNSIPGIKFSEMPRNRENSLCCGISSWHCNLLTKSIRMDRLNEAENVADILVTTCPKCKIHFECLKSENIEELSKKFKIEITDLPSLLIKALFL
ncbi:MAG: (Fe-S)-binding protein [Candidatus Helarchaeota archaeon]